MTPVEQIKTKIDIVEFIRSYVPLQPAGKNFKAPCPFHKEKTPSFMVSPERQTWHCFGACAEGGDIFKFLMKRENLEFYEALKILAEKAGVELKRISPQDYKQFGILYDINDSANNFFKDELQKNKRAVSYLNERGLKKETLEEFEIGFAPQSFDALTVYLLNLGYDVKDVERAGLNFKSEKGNYIDRFRGRIIFPLYNHFGKIVGFSGRILPEFDTGETGKYVNTPETSIFNKSRILYGLYKTKSAIREQNAAILVEGPMDFLMCHQDGLKNVIAVSGTALTPDHLKLLKRFAEEIIFCFDNDEAGLKAAERSIDLANGFDFNVKTLILKDYKDPAETVSKKPGLMAKMAKEANHAMEFYLDRYLLRGQKSDQHENIIDFKKNIRIVLGKIKNLASPVERHHWLKELSLKLKIEERVLAEEMEQLKVLKDSRLSSPEARPASAGSTLNPRQFASSRLELIASRLIGLAMHKEAFVQRLEEHAGFLPGDYATIFEKLAKKTQPESELLDLFNFISLHSSFKNGFVLDEELMEEEFGKLVSGLRFEFYKEKRRRLAGLIKDAEKNGNEEDLAAVLKEFDEVSKIMENA